MEQDSSFKFSQVLRNIPGVVPFNSLFSLASQSTKIGQPPGSMIYLGQARTGPPKLRSAMYGPGVFQTSDHRPDEVPPGHYLWLDCEGIHELDFVRQITSSFNVHPLAAEDIVNTAQRSKFEQFPEHLFLLVKRLHWDADRKIIQPEHVSICLFDHTLVSFQELTGDIFTPVRKRLEAANTRLRTDGTDYLMYALLDMVVGQYFAVFDPLNEELAQLEVEINDQPSPKHLGVIRNLRQSVMLIRRAANPLQEILRNIIASDNTLIQDETRVYFRELQFQASQINETVDSIYQYLNNLQDLHLSLVNHRTNEVMRTLTVFTAIFMPISFLTGVFGMNFTHMPGINNPWSFSILCAVWLLLGGGMLWYFWRKKWL